MGEIFEGFKKPNTTPTPDEFFDIVLPQVNNLAELKVILYVIRRTFGFGKSTDRISFEQFINGIETEHGKLDGGTGLTRQSVADGLRKAIAHGYIRRIIVCPDCGEEITRDKPPQYCPFCKEKIQGRVKIYYGLRWAEAPSQENRLGSLKDRPGGPKDRLGVVYNLDLQETVIQETEKILYPSGERQALPLLHTQEEKTAGRDSSRSPGRPEASLAAEPVGDGRGDVRSPGGPEVSPVGQLAPGRWADLPLPELRREVFDALRRCEGNRRRQISILTRAIGKLLGFGYAEGCVRTEAVREDYKRIGNLVKQFGLEKVWDTACRIAGKPLEGNAIDYLQAVLEYGGQNGHSGRNNFPRSGDDYSDVYEI